MKEDGQNPSDNNNDGDGNPDVEVPDSSNDNNSDNPTISEVPDYSSDVLGGETAKSVTSSNSTSLLQTSVSSSSATSNLLSFVSSQSQQLPQSETANNASQTADNRRQELPNTGMHETHLAAMVGAILLGLLGTIPFSSKHKHD
ncbi:LPXTG cell wall anchor domain-containing protein [Furfurilactobacillus rossiae]